MPIKYDASAHIANRMLRFFCSFIIHKWICGILFIIYSQNRLQDICQINANAYTCIRSSVRAYIHLQYRCNWFCYEWDDGQANEHTMQKENKDVKIDIVTFISNIRFI